MSRVSALCLALLGSGLLHAEEISLADQEKLKDRVPKVERKLASDREQGLAAARKSYSAPYLSDAALKVIVDGYPNLTSVSALCHGHVSDDGIQQICRLKKVSSVYLAGTAVTDEGVRRLAEKKQITRLMFRDCGVTDAGLKYLATMPKLKWVRLYRTRVTKAGVAEFRKQKPECTVYVTPAPQAADSES